MRVLALLGSIAVGFGQLGDRGAEFWQGISAEAKVVFVQGLDVAFNRSMAILNEEIARQKSRDSYWRTPFELERSKDLIKEHFSPRVGRNYELVARLLDAFYSNPDNAPIDVVSAHRVVMLHNAGEVERANRLLLELQKGYLKDN